MKKLLAIFAIALIVGQAGAQTVEYLQQKDFQTEKKKNNDGINVSKKQLIEVKKADAKIVQSVDSIRLTLKVNELQLRANSDSLAKASAKLDSLKEQFDGQKSASRGLLILLFLILLVLFIIVIILLFQVKKKADTDHQSMVDLNKMTNERLDSEVRSMNTELLGSKETMRASSAELNQKISTGFDSVETRNQRLESLLHENISKTGGMISNLKQDIGQVSQEQANAIKILEEKFNVFKHEAMSGLQKSETMTLKLEKEVAMLIEKK